MPKIPAKLLTVGTSSVVVSGLVSFILDGELGGSLLTADGISWLVCFSSGGSMSMEDI